MENQGEIKLKIQKLLGAEITQFLLKGQGYCNDAYYVETGEDNKYIVKQERNNKKAEEQNNLLVEAGVIQELYKMNLSVPSPCVVFVSEKPKMYGYKYIEGEMMKDVWGSLSEKEKIDICHTIGIFHAEIGKVFTKEIARASSVKIDESPYVHPEVTDEYNKALASVDVPDEFKMLVKKAKVIFDGTSKKVVFQFIHNDPHHENIIIRDKKISGIIDFGAAEWGEVAKEFSRYIRDYPDYFQHIVSAYEKESGHKLSYERLVSNALLCDFPDIVENYRKGGKSRTRAENSINSYKKLIEEVRGK